MDKLDVQAGGFKFDRNELNFWQDAVSKGLQQLSLMAGNNVILEGVEVDNGSVSDGVIIYDKEVLPFVGGSHSNTVIIYETVTLVEYNEDIDDDGNKDMKSGLIKRFAKCGVGGVANFPFTDLKRIRNLQNTRFLGETVDFAGTADKVPHGWLPCDGRSLLKADYAELYDLLGDAYGSTTTTFRIPMTIDRMAVGAGNEYELGDIGGAKTHTLTIPEMPEHDHSYTLEDTQGSGSEGAEDGRSSFNYNAKTSKTGSGQPHNNMPPYIAFNKIIFVGY